MPDNNTGAAQKTCNDLVRTPHDKADCNKADGGTVVKPASKMLGKQRRIVCPEERADG